ncbi:MAG: hypothetical protein AAF414_06975 [Pseudomonadota bacterium]
MLIWAKWLGFVFLVAVLTALTQIGGVVLILAWLAARLAWSRGRRLVPGIAIFALVYAGASLWIVPPLAELGGRQALPCGLGPEAPVRPHGFIYCALNRHYASPLVAAMLDDLAADMAQAYPGMQIVYLDANFPFLDGFPLPPHLSHDDGFKIDLPCTTRTKWVGRPLF